MQKAIGLEKYDSATKDTWRGWQWNRVLERLPELRIGGRLSDREVRAVCSKKVVLYLCGPDDFDGIAAQKRGFSRENLIAVDINDENISRVRRAGGIGIIGRLERIIDAWDRQPIDVVIADTCSGFGSSVFDLRVALATSHAIGSDTVVSMNLKRGRDAVTNYVRKEIKNDPLIREHSSSSYLIWNSVFSQRKVLVRRGVSFDTKQDMSSEATVEAACQIVFQFWNNCFDTS